LWKPNPYEPFCKGFFYADVFTEVTKKTFPGVEKGFGKGHFGINDDARDLAPLLARFCANFRYFFRL
jgi:hypothetical protein